LTKIYNWCIISYIHQNMNYSIKEDMFERFPRFLQSNVLLYCLVLLLAVKIAVTLVTINIPQNIFFADITKFALENFINQSRKAIGEPALVVSQKLNQAAQLKAENMVQNQYFSHTSPTGITPWYWFSQVGYSYKYAGENLAIGFFDSKEVYDAWLNSPSHRANILNPKYTEVGTAILGGFGPNNSIVVVQEFGSQLPAKQTAVNSAPKPTATKPAAPAISPESQANEPAVSSNTQEQVLSQATESQSSIEAPKGTSASNFYSKLLNFVLYNYNGLLQSITYGVSLVIIGILLTLVFFNSNIDFKRELVFRAVLILAILSVANLFNREVIIAIIPHQIII